MSNICVNGNEPDINTIIFHSTTPEGQEETLRISQDGFFYKGEKVEDIHNIYERFNEWLTGAEVNKQDEK